MTRAEIKIGKTEYQIEREMDYGRSSGAVSRLFLIGPKGARYVAHRFADGRVVKQRQSTLWQ